MRRSPVSFVRVIIATTISLFLMSERNLKTVLAQDNQQCSEHPFDIPFIPGNSCEEIYNKNAQARDEPGYYWILKQDGPSRDYCAMNYSLLACLVMIYMTVILQLMINQVIIVSITISGCSVI